MLPQKGGTYVQNGNGSKAIGRLEGGAAIEAEPAKPEHCSADHHERDVVGLVFLMGGLPASQNKATDQGGDSAGDVDDSASSKVNRAHRLEPARLELGGANSLLPGLSDGGESNENSKQRKRRVEDSRRQ